MLAVISFALIKTQRTENFHSFAFNARCKTVIHMRRRAGRTNMRAHTNKSQTDTGKWERGKKGVGGGECTTDNAVAIAFAHFRSAHGCSGDQFSNALCQFGWSVAAVLSSLGFACCSLEEVRGLEGVQLERRGCWRKWAAIENVIDLSPAHPLGFVMWPFCKLNTNSQFLHIWLQLHCSGFSLNTQTNTHTCTLT